MSEFYIEYSESGRTLRYSLENLMPGSETLIHTERVGPWLHPYASEPLSPVQRALIAARICEALSFLGERMAVVGERKQGHV